MNMMKPWYSLPIRGDGLSLVASLHEHRQQHHSPVLGGHVQRCDAVAAGFCVWCGMPARDTVQGIEVVQRCGTIAVLQSTISIIVQQDTHNASVLFLGSQVEGSEKERKGKERKGKERKGKERKGKERKGKERKGKERKGKMTPFGGVNLKSSQMFERAARATTGSQRGVSEGPYKDEQLHNVDRALFCCMVQRGPVALVLHHNQLLASSIQKGCDNIHMPHLSSKMQGGCSPARCLGSADNQWLHMPHLYHKYVHGAVPALESPVTGISPQGLQMVDDLQTPPLTGAVQNRDPSMVLSHGVTPRLQKAPEGAHVTALSSTLQSCVASHIHQLDIGSCLNQPLNHLHYT
ncbi:MAG: hypothetical protein FRX49_06533 [Trebouxia sp. A1-2]|nr:MAG: hypothetical protein FRX49_06533 [Trebouxia sp. A1-2]